MVTIIHSFPGHAVAFIVRGYLAMEAGNIEQRDEFYVGALAALEDDAHTFQRYISWDYPQFEAFRLWLGEHHPQQFQQMDIQEIRA